jgi:hypothetical protein
MSFCAAPSLCSSTLHHLLRMEEEGEGEGSASLLGGAVGSVSAGAQQLAHALCDAQCLHPRGHSGPHSPGSVSARLRWHFASRDAGPALHPQCPSESAHSQEEGGSEHPAQQVRHPSMRSFCSTTIVASTSGLGSVVAVAFIAREHAHCSSRSITCGMPPCRPALESDSFQFMQCPLLPRAVRSDARSCHPALLSLVAMRGQRIMG